jgi:hypothetical protein
MVPLTTWRVTHSNPMEYRCQCQVSAPLRLASLEGAGGSVTVRCDFGRPRGHVFVAANLLRSLLHAIRATFTRDMPPSESCVDRLIVSSSGPSIPSVSSACAGIAGADLTCYTGVSKGHALLEALWAGLREW